MSITLDDRRILYACIGRLFPVLWDTGATDAGRMQAVQRAKRLCNLLSDTDLEARAVGFLKALLDALEKGDTGCLEWVVGELCALANVDLQ